jgi:hypothetical protein
MTENAKTRFDIDKHKYIHLQDFIDRKSCDEFTDQLIALDELGALNPDKQSPLSGCIGHSAIFDSILEQLLPSVERMTNKKLYPTYSYARLYNKGDELEAHRDRPSCEISLTITLGYFGKVWPFWIGELTDDTTRREINLRGEGIAHVKNEIQIDMKVGDAVLYRGMEVLHWRYPYVEGRHQAQVFLHYVDANGPHAEWKYDKREKLAHHG